MSPVNTDLYAGSCNPSRRAKPSRLVEPSDLPLSPPESHRTLPIQPRKSQPTPPTLTAMAVDEPEPSASAPTPAKRGRKPGTMSRAARETQRKINHSIIEKARRTKINDALATLRQLVPSDFGKEKQANANEDEEDDAEEDEDGDYQDKKTKPKKTGKKEEKEREFKLEILIRTVTYMQHLIGKVKDLEEQIQNQAGGAPMPHDISASQTERKRKREEIIDIVGNADDACDASRRRLDHPSPDDHHRPPVHPRLPSISAWLPEMDPSLQISPGINPISSMSMSSVSPALRPAVSAPSISPALVPLGSIRRSPNHTHTYLPSPPSSTQFIPMTPSISMQLPSLSLGPTMSRSRRGSSTIMPATPEEENAASLLLNFRQRGSSCSPAFMPTSPVFGAGVSGVSEPFELGPRIVGVQGGERIEREREGVSATVSMVAQTPSSILGLGGR
ncbi:hypothetical protein AAF712_016070 [Marasmius tenuissimus]|uniref:BHLH domain-containing protein n=1 Tax=Marasmius tenuissimus TaxID=585030 RepID=A0ABR2Z7P6_9AGAR